MRRIGLGFLSAALTITSAGAAQRPVHPREHLGFEVGADRKLADWPEITAYFARLAASSRAVRVDTLGPSTNGQPFIVATISAPENIARLAASARARRCWRIRGA